MTRLPAAPGAWGSGGLNAVPQSFLLGTDHEQRLANQVAHEEALIKRLTHRLQMAQSIGKRDRFCRRIVKARARLLALKLSQP